MTAALVFRILTVEECDLFSEILRAKFIARHNLGTVSPDGAKALGGASPNEPPLSPCGWCGEERCSDPVGHIISLCAGDSRWIVRCRACRVVLVGTQSSDRAAIEAFAARHRAHGVDAEWRGSREVHRVCLRDDGDCSDADILPNDRFTDFRVPR